MNESVRRRLLPRALLAVLVGSLVVGCSGDVSVDSPELSRADSTACSALLELLPDEMEGLAEVEVTPEDAPARAWGDPAVVVTCGVSMPDDFDEMSPCEEINGVGWFVRPEEYSDSDAELDMTTIGFSPAVRLQVPGEQRPPAGALVTVSDAVKEALEQTKTCA